LDAKVNNILPLRLIIGLILAVWFFMALSTRVMATEEDILLFDNFDDGNLNGWTIESGNWQVNNGNLAGSSSGKALGGRINTGNSEWDNYRIELDINSFLGIDQGVGFRYGENGSYEINLRYGKGIHNTPQIILWKIDGNGQTLLKEIKPLSLANNKWYHLIIEVSNENIKAWIDNTPIFDFTDTGTNIKKGTITLSYWTGIFGGAYMKFDNIKVSALAPSHPPRLPVIFIPGIGGSEMKASQDIFWSSDDGHGGTYSHAYGGEEKIWVNQDEAVKLGNDDYFDILRLKADGVTSEAALVLTGELTSFGYSDIDPFFTEMGYDKGTNFFVFPYDWRKDVRTTKDDLDALIVDKSIEKNVEKEQFEWLKSNDKYKQIKKDETNGSYEVHEYETPDGEIGYQILYYNDFGEVIRSKGYGIEAESRTWTQTYPTFTTFTTTTL